MIDTMDNSPNNGNAPKQVLPLDVTMSEASSEPEEIIYK